MQYVLIHPISMWPHPSSSQCATAFRDPIRGGDSNEEPLCPNCMSDIVEEVRSTHLLLYTRLIFSAGRGTSIRPRTRRGSVPTEKITTTKKKKKKTSTHSRDSSIPPR